MMRNGQDPITLHTLAAVYAEMGKTTEARQTILQSIELAGKEEPASEDWYVFGRIAENYGEYEAALECYGKVEAPEIPAQDSTHRLTANRLELMRGKIDQ